MSTTQPPTHCLADPRLADPRCHAPAARRPGPLRSARTAAPVGTVLAVPGRGDGPGSLTGLADRLALDGYEVHVLAGGDPQEAASRLDEAARHSEARRQTGPTVLLGIDSGVLAVLLAARRGISSAGLVLAGMPGDNAGLAASGPDEARVRLRDPVQRARLTTDGDLRLGELLADPLPAAELDALFDDSVRVPALVLHGDSDPLCPLPLASRRALRLRRLRMVSVSQTAHDVFRDTHRASAIAEVLLFAERLRGGPTAPPQVRSLVRATW